MKNFFLLNFMLGFSIMFFFTEPLFSQYILELTPNPINIKSKTFILTDNSDVIYQLKYTDSIGPVKKGKLEMIGDEFLKIDGQTFRLTDIYMIGFTTLNRIIFSVSRFVVNIVLVPSAFFIVGFMYAGIMMLIMVNPQLYLDDVPSKILGPVLLVTSSAILAAIFGGLGFGGWLFNKHLHKTFSKSFSFKERIYLDNAMIRVLKNEK